MKSNESFSGGGHARHLCKDCGQLGQEELSYRQAVRNIGRMIQWDTGRVKRKQRSNFANFLRHPDERIRQYAESVAAGSALADREDRSVSMGNATDVDADEEVLAEADGVNAFPATTGPDFRQHK
jgi:hypothetical protein